MNERDAGVKPTRNTIRLTKETIKEREEARKRHDKLYGDYKMFYEEVTFTKAINIATTSMVRRLYNKLTNFIKSKLSNSLSRKPE